MAVGVGQRGADRVESRRFCASLVDVFHGWLPGRLNKETGHVFGCFWIASIPSLRFLVYPTIAHRGRTSDAVCGRGYRMIGTRNCLQVARAHETYGFKPMTKRWQLSSCSLRKTRVVRYVT